LEDEMIKAKECYDAKAPARPRFERCVYTLLKPRATGVGALTGDDDDDDEDGRAGTVIVIVTTTTLAPPPPPTGGELRVGVSEDVGVEVGVEDEDEYEIDSSPSQSSSIEDVGVGEGTSSGVGEGVGVVELFPDTTPVVLLNDAGIGGPGKRFV
jgi:hypothetical protein